MSDSSSNQDTFDQFASSSGAGMFLVGEGFCLVFAFLYHKFLCNDKTSSTVRHAVALVLGVAVGFMTYGSSFFHVILQSGICYSAIVVLPTSSISIGVFVVAMGYLLCVHYTRAFGEQDSLYSIDVSGPLMLATQKMTSLGFSIGDGSLKKTDQLSDLRKKYLVMKRPSALEYFSYIFHFQALLAGPISFYCDYMAYVDGTDYNCNSNDLKKSDENNGKRRYHNLPYRCVAEKIGCVLVFILLQAYVQPIYDFELNIDPDFIRTHSLLYKTWYHVISMMCVRIKYYLAFMFGDAICNMAGFGFNGFDEHGKEKWDLLTNVNVFKTEFAMSPKDMMDNWNIQTTLWLRHVCFDRVPTQKRILTFTISGIWHGLYPGYYFTFLLGGFFFTIVRQLRKKVRPYFLNSTAVKAFYDVMTLLLTHIVMSYMLGPFQLLHLGPTIAFYNSLYWWVHILMMTLFVVLPFVPSPAVAPATKANGAS